MNPLRALAAPPLIPDHQRPEYQAVRRVLENHPTTAGMDQVDMSSFAQQLLEEMEQHWLTGEELDEQTKERIEEAYSGFRDLLERKKRPQYLDEAIPDWARERYAEEQQEPVPAAEPSRPLSLEGAA